MIAKGEEKSWHRRYNCPEGERSGTHEQDWEGSRVATVLCWTVLHDISNILNVLWQPSSRISRGKKKSCHHVPALGNSKTSCPFASSAVGQTIHRLPNQRHSQWCSGAAVPDLQKSTKYRRSDHLSQLAAGFTKSSSPIARTVEKLTLMRAVYRGRIELMDLPAAGWNRRSSPGPDAEPRNAAQ